MSPRFNALEEVSKRNRLYTNGDVVKPRNSSENFGVHVFNRTVMQKMLPKDIFRNILNAIEGREKIKSEYADPIAVALKEWAISLGATHYSHWFQPLTGASAEKHDAFIEWNTPDGVIERFSGKQLLQGEPDASSFPSGGLRSTYEARGYTGWDTTSPPFLWKAGDGVTLCIPSVFFSWTGDVLDSKIPLLRSDKKLNEACLRLLKLTGIPATLVHSTVGLEQEYFVIDRALRNLRPDLLLMGRTVCGAPSPKGQELQDHYFGAVKDRILHFMTDFENAALQLGIPVKTRHNEVAPAQHEVAPVFEKSSVAIDHNILLMELMRQIAQKHNLACLLHEKPFKGINGSGKHCNWSISTESGINLLDPSDTPGNNLHFLILLTAILHAVHSHSALLRASIGSAANDYRLGGHEAPPSIISVYLGKEMEHVLENIEHKGSHPHTSVKAIYDFGLSAIPDLTRDNTDRNRTSPFAFTGNKFEFRAVGSSSNPAFAVTVLNSIVAESLTKMLDEIEEKLGSQKAPSRKVLLDVATPIIRKYLKSSRDIRFHGDNYSQDWIKEAQKRKLPIIDKAIDAFEALKEKSTVDAFTGILNKQELESRYEIWAEHYAHTISIETKLLLEIFRTQVFPAALQYQKEMASSLAALHSAVDVKKYLKEQETILKDFSQTIETTVKIANELEELAAQVAEIPKLETRAKAYANQILPKTEELREVIDKLEASIDDKLWPLPKYRELLFMV